MPTVRDGRLCAAAVLLVLVAAFAAPAAGAADDGPGGIVAISAPAGDARPSTVSEAALIGDRAIPPLDAPAAVRRVIAAANQIRHTPYVWGGGHRSWWSHGYDCSGSVSYALHGAGWLRSPLVSGSFMRWGAPGPGRWITIYANGSHVYAEIAGLRWDTSGNARGTGPRWHTSPSYPAGFAVRHPIGY